LVGDDGLGSSFFPSAEGEADIPQVVMIVATPITAPEQAIFIYKLMKISLPTLNTNVAAYLVFDVLSYRGVLTQSL